MSRQPIEVLSDAVNGAVVRMPGRQFPGIVVQGDSLIGLTSASQALLEQANKIGDAQLMRKAGNLHYMLEDLMARYREGCELSS